MLYRCVTFKYSYIIVARISANVSIKSYISTFFLFYNVLFVKIPTKRYRTCNEGYYKWNQY